jgi:hypothetical protein
MSANMPLNSAAQRVYVSNAINSHKSGTVIKIIYFYVFNCAPNLIDRRITLIAIYKPAHTNHLLSNCESGS